MDGIILNRGGLLHFPYPPSHSLSASSSSSFRVPPCSSSLYAQLGGLSSPHLVLGPHGPRQNSWVSAAGSESVAAADILLHEWKDEEDRIKAGGNQLLFVQMQALKDLNHPSICAQLEPITGQGILDLVVIGCGPAGLALAAESAKAGLSVGMIGPDLPFTNNYGVWEDEFKALGLENCIEHVWKDTAVHLDFNKPFLMGRAYGRVSRYLLHKELLRRCAEAGVKYLDCKVEGIVEDNDSGSIVSCSTGMLVSCRLVTAASGAASGRFLSYEQGGPLLCVQTAYGIEVEVENCPYDPEVMVFMDYRDFKNPSSSSNPMDPPSFLYVMPLSSTRVFFEETCLAARPCLSFDLLKQRLYARLTDMGIKVKHVYEEEWSYIPVGGSIPDTTQQHLGFGAAASMVHPATGYSVVRSLSEAPLYAHAIASALKSDMKNGRISLESAIPAKMAAIKAWNSLWPNERKRQRAFFLFGLELILKLDIEGTRMFFDTFFKLPDWMWKGFLAAKLSSVDLIWFSFATFLIAPNQLRYHLVRHLIVDASGAYLVRAYTSTLLNSGL